MPRSLERNVLGVGNAWPDGNGLSKLTPRTLTYVAGKAAEGLKSPVILPDGAGSDTGGGVAAALTTISGNSAGGKSAKAGDRKSTLQFRTLSAAATEALRLKCRAESVSVTAALASAVAFTSSDLVAGVGANGKKERNYKVLQSLDMRRVSSDPDPLETMSCQAGSMDLMLGPFADGSGRKLAGDFEPEQFWDVARESQAQTKLFVESGGPEQAVRVFDFAMTISDLNNLVHLTAQSESSQGRAYSAGVSNAGVYERQPAAPVAGFVDRDTLKANHGRYAIEDVHFATSHARSGCLYQVSCLTVDGKARFTFHPAAPIVSEREGAAFADYFVDLLEVAAGTKKASTVKAVAAEEDKKEGEKKKKSLVSLTGIAAISGAAGILLHAGGWASFFESVQTMKANIPDDADFWAALNFWIFFAVAHPILQPILWISEVLHGSPGNQIADLLPITFLLGNVVVIAALALSKELRNALNVALVGAFFAYVGGGIDGQLGLGDFNLQLDDSYKGSIVKGCPAYNEVRQPSMDNFDLNKYQGLWYEHKFHDWTQFKEVYDTTLDIKLTDGGQGWLDDFGVKGPAPKAAPLSWDKSPVANGAHYFLFGRVDKNDPPGVLRESGFGVEFPNYIVDVKKDQETGEYREAIQFQCLERGGVRVFEGINFMSRSPEMTDGELKAMHARAAAAGMEPYGSGEEQMHRVARRPLGEGDVDNSWQAMWRFIGVDKLLELLTESIEDGGR